MPYYELEYTVTVPEWDSMIIEADDMEDAEDKLMDKIREDRLEVVDIEVNVIREIKKNG